MICAKCGARRPDCNKFTCDGYVESIAAKNRPGTIAARFEFLLQELCARFPEAVNEFSSEPVELRLLTAIDNLKRDIDNK